MKKVFFLLSLLSLTASAQTTRQKVLYMQAVRTNGSTSARLEGTEGFLGPIYNPETRRLLINGTSRTLNSIKEIRFEIREEDVPDGIEKVEAGTPATDDSIHDLSGRKVREETASRGIYIKGGRKFIKK